MNTKCGLWFQVSPINRTLHELDGKFWQSNSSWSSLPEFGAYKIWVPKYEKRWDMIFWWAISQSKCFDNSMAEKQTGRGQLFCIQVQMRCMKWRSRWSATKFFYAPMLFHPEMTTHRIFTRNTTGGVGLQIEDRGDSTYPKNGTAVKNWSSLPRLSFILYYCFQNSLYYFYFTLSSLKWVFQFWNQRFLTFISLPLFITFFTFLLIFRHYFHFKLCLSSTLLNLLLNHPCQFTLLDLY